MAQVQKNGGTTSGSASIVPTLGSATTAGNAILIFVTGAGTITTPSGFTSRSPQVNLQGHYLFDKLTASGNSSDTPTLTMSGAYNATWLIVEYSGITAYKTSDGNNSSNVANGSKATQSITPTTGGVLLVASVAVTASIQTATFAAGDPQSWTNSFTGEQSVSLVGINSAGRDAMAGGWASRQVTANGSTSYSTAATFTSNSGTGAPATIIAAYAHTAGSTYTLSAVGGTYALTGTAATPKHGWKPSAASSSYAITGIAATPKHGWKPTAAIGSYAMTGTDATLTKSGAAGSRSLPPRNPTAFLPFLVR